MAKNYEGRKENGEGNVRKLPSGKYECVVQSKYINPKTGKQKRQPVKKQSWILSPGRRKLREAEIQRLIKPRPLANICLNILRQR